VCSVMVVCFFKKKKKKKKKEYVFGIFFLAARIAHVGTKVGGCH